MAAIAAANVTITTNGKLVIRDDGHTLAHVSVAFGNGTLTYPAGGIPLSGLTAQGFPSAIETVQFEDEASANGYIYKYSRANNSIRIYQGDNANAAAAPAVELGGAVAPAATTLYLEVTGY